MAGPQSNHEFQQARTVIDTINHGTEACLVTQSSQACYQAAYQQADNLLNAEWKKLPQADKSALLPEQRQWLNTRNYNFGNPDEAAKPGAMPAVGAKDALASLPSVRFVEQRAAQLADRVDKTNY